MALETTLLIFVFLTGLCVGSFLNVVIYRLPLDKSVVSPRSHCPACQKLIPWYRNFPLVSYALLRGKCGDCGTRISARYPLVELVTAALFTVAAAHEPAYGAWPFHFYFMAALVACTFIDLDHWILPDKITLPGILIGLASAFVVPNHGIVDALLGTLFGGGILYLIAWGYLAATGKDGLGGGDVKFLAMVGAFLGIKGAVVTLILSSLVGSVFGIFLMAVKGKKGETAIPFGPFLAGGSLLAFFFGEQVWRWYFGMS